MAEVFGFAVLPERVVTPIAIQAMALEIEEGGGDAGFQLV